jgi:MFS family permease
MALAANAIPQILLYLFGGVLGDRLPRRTIVLVADCVAGVATAGLAVAAVGGNLGLGGLLAGSGTLGVTAALYGPAYNAIVPDVLPRALLLEGNALLEVSGNLARVAGPLVAGITYAFGGAAITFGLDAVSFMISAGCMALTVVPPTHVAYRGTVYRGIRDGIAYIGKTRWILLVISVSLVANAALPGSQVLGFYRCSLACQPEPGILLPLTCRSSSITVRARRGGRGGWQTAQSGTRYSIPGTFRCCGPTSSGGHARAKSRKRC